MIRPVPKAKVSRNTKAEGKCDHRTGMVIVRTGSEGGVEISCGWFKVHLRKKVCEDSAQRHLDKHHGGQGIWL